MLVTRRIGTVAFASSCIIGVLLGAGNAFAQDHGPTVWSIINARPLGGVQLVDANRDLQDALAKVGETIRTQRLDEAVESLQALINADRPVLFPRWDDPRRYISSSEVATRILGLLPGSAIERANRQSEGAARRYYEEACRDLREDMLLRTGRQYFHTAGGADAWNTLAALAFDRGAFLEAAHLWETLYMEQRLSRLDRPLVLAKAVIAAHMGGWKSKAADLSAILGGAHANAKAAIGGREQNVLGFVRQSLAGAVPPAVAPQVVAQWGSVGGTADGFAVMPECAVSPLVLWKQEEKAMAANVNALLRLGGDGGEPGQTRVEAGVSDGRVRVTIRRPGEQEFSFNLPSMVHPVVLADRIVCRREDGVEAVATDGGRELWRAAYPMCRGDSAGRTVNHYLPLAGDVGRYAGSAGEGLVFAVGRFRRLDPDTYSKFAATLEMDTSSLAAFSAADGKPVWEIGCGKGDTDAVRSAKYLTAPTYCGGRLYAIAKYGNRYQAICLEARTGRRVWDVPIGPIPTHSGEQMSWQAAYTMEIMTERASAPSVVNGVVYLTTNTGLVMAIEAETGSPLWAYRYESRVSTTADIGRSFEVANMAFLIAASRRPFPPANPIVVVRGRVIVAPADADALLALHALSGERLWQSPRQGRRDLSAVDDNRVLLSGPGLVFVGVNDGGTVRQVDSDVEDRPAVTRSAVVASGLGRLVRVELSDYSVSAQVATDRFALLGRLVSAGGRLVAANGAGVSVYLGFDDAWATLSRKLKETSDPRQRAEWLLQRGVMAFHANRTGMAVDEFRAAGEVARAAGADDMRRVQPWLFRSLLRLAGESRDEAEVMRCIAEAEGAAAGDGGRDLVRLAKMCAYERFGKVGDAVAIAQSVAETDGGRWISLPAGDRDAGAGWLTAYLWGQGQIGRMVREHGQAAYSRFDALLDAAVERGTQDGDPESLLAARRRWPHAARADRALYLAAEMLWRRCEKSTDAAAAARVDRVLGEIGVASQLSESAKAAQALLDSRFRPMLLPGNAPTNTQVAFGDYRGSLGEILERGRQAALRFPVGPVSFAGVTGGLAFAWGPEDGVAAVLRTADGGPVLASDRRLCVQDEQSVKCIDVQRTIGHEAPLWRIGVARVGSLAARSGYYCAERDLLAVMTPEHVLLVEAATGREVTRKTTREMGVYPWTRAVGDGTRVVFANDRQDWVASVVLPDLSREWWVRGNGFRGDRLVAGCDLTMVHRPWSHASARFLDSRTGRQVLSIDSWALQAAMNADGFCAAVVGERGERLEFHDPRRQQQSLIGRLALTNTVHDLVAFGDRHAVVQEKRDGSVLRLVDIAEPASCMEVHLRPESMTNRVILGTAWESNRLFIVSGVPGGRDGLASGVALSAVDISSGVVAWHRDIGSGRGGLCRVRGVRRYGKVLSLLVVPHDEGSPARYLLVDGADGRVLGNFSEPFGRPGGTVARAPEWAGAPVVLNGRVVFETGDGLVCFVEPL